MKRFSKSGQATQLRAWATRLAAGAVVTGGLAGCSPPPTPNTGGASSTLQQKLQADQLSAASHQTDEQKYCAAFLTQQTDADGNTPTFQHIEAENGAFVIMESLPGPALVSSGFDVFHRLYKGIHSGAGPLQDAGSIIASLPEMVAGIIPIPGVGVAADAVTSATNNVAAALGEKPELLPESNIGVMQKAEECDPNAAAADKGLRGRAAERTQAVHKNVTTLRGGASADKSSKSPVKAAAPS